jgi:hypothetical protein
VYQTTEPQSVQRSIRGSSQPKGVRQPQVTSQHDNRLFKASITEEDFAEAQKSYEHLKQQISQLNTSLSTFIQVNDSK